MHVKKIHCTKIIKEKGKLLANSFTMLICILLRRTPHKQDITWGNANKVRSLMLDRYFITTGTDIDADFQI